MKKFSLRLEVNFNVNNNDEAKRMAELFIKELPRMEGLTIKNASVYNQTEKRLISTDVR